LTAAECAASPSLKDVFAQDFLIGAALNQDQIAGDKPSETAIITKHFNTITPENILKWESVHPQPDKYNFEPADKYVALGEKNNMFIVGHTLVWHNQTPKWVFQDANGNDTNRETLLARMKEHIFTVVGRYKGRINGWDVVNEAVGEDGQFRKNKWFEIIGEDYVAKAFEFARQADPKAELYYNDYNMWKKSQREGVIRLVKDLRAKGIRVDGIGIQGHWGLDYPPLDELEDSIRAFSELGVKLMITEMDITILPSAWDQKGADITQNFKLQNKLNPYPDALPDEMQEKLAKRYAELFAIFHKYRDKFSRVTFWGVQDGNSWRNNWPVKGRSDYPLLFDRNCQPKPAFDAVIKVP
jgi:endo-1,4-beta-xylanase